MSTYSSLIGRSLLGMMLACLIAAPAASAGEGNKGDGNSKNADKQKMQDTGMPSGMAATDTTEGGKKAKVIKADKMDKKKLKAELEAASDDTVIEYKGKKQTKKQLKAEAAKRDQEAQDAMKAGPSTASSSPNTVIEQFNQQEKMKLDAANAKVHSEMTRLIRLNPAVEGAASQGTTDNPAEGAVRQRSIDAPIQAAPTQQNVR